MQKQLRDKWVEALRSGKYVQGHSQLRTEVGFCCIGVLCDVINPSDWRRHGLSNMWIYGTTALNMPTAVAGFAKLTSDAENYLTILNDRERKSFPEIADYIEQNVPVE